MRKAQQRQIQELMQQMEEAHRQIIKYIELGSIRPAMELLANCQNAGITIGTLVESAEGEGHPTVALLEVYCELVYQFHESLKGSNEGGNSTGKICKLLRQKFIRIQNSLKNDIVIKREAVFLPYKASMWDSLESVWKAADADPDCDAYVIPIPYYDKNPDGSFREMHYEGDQYPEDVPITPYDAFDFGAHHPDMIFIHNPYDNSNLVTSVHPFFYSDNLKKNTDCLVYIPYYATAGDMSEGQQLCPAYINADYIVIQSEKYRKFFDSNIPQRKFLAFGSPKFDNIIKKCQNPPEPPKEWKDKMEGRTVYFYNTSIGGMLENTEDFLKKMEYVFDTFQGRADACLLWRPHPLLEATLNSMRPQFKMEFIKLKERFLRNNLGIYDTSSCMEDTIANSDVYIGDAGTSVISLFGIVGKPIFILDNSIHTPPEKGDWHGSIVQTLRGDLNNRYCITEGDKLYVSRQNNGYYEYFCDLTNYTGGGYYLRAIEYKEKIYAVPANAQNILSISKDKKVKQIPLKEKIAHPGAFAGFYMEQEYLFLIPNQYPDLIRFNMETESVDYITNIASFYIGNVNGIRTMGTSWMTKGNLYFLNAGGTRLLILNIRNLTIDLKNVSINRVIAAATLRKRDDDEVWLIPNKGTIVTRWNLLTGEMRDYNVAIPGLKAIHRQYNVETDLKVIGTPAFLDEYLIFPPVWGNKFIQLNQTDGSVKEWIPPFAVRRAENPYFKEWCIGYFNKTLKEDVYFYFFEPERKTYEINMRTLECRDMNIDFLESDVFSHVPGFSRKTQWLQYCCREDVFNSLRDLLDGAIKGSQHNAKEQIEAFQSINANIEGTCGERVYKKLIMNS